MGRPIETSGGPHGGAPKPLPNKGGKKRVNCFKAPKSEVRIAVPIADVKDWAKDWGIKAGDFMEPGKFFVRYKIQTFFAAEGPSGGIFGVGTQPTTPPRETNEDVIEVHKRRDGPILEAKAKTESKKAKLLRRKVHKHYKKPDGYKASDIASELISEFTDLSISGVDDVNTKVYDMNLNGVMLWDALVRLGRLTGTRWYIDEDDVFHFYLPGTRKPRYLTKLGTTTAVPAPAEKGSAKVTRDAANIRNRVQVYAAVEDTPDYNEKFKGDGVQTEFPLSYVPAWCTVSVSVNGEPYAVYQDWGERNQEYSPPSCSGGEFGTAYVNLQRGFLRFETPPADGATIEVTYRYKAPLFLVVDDPASIAQWGLRETNFVVPEKLSAWEAERLALAFLAEFSQPRTTVTCNLFDLWDLQVGHTVEVVMPELGVEREMTVFAIEKTWDNRARGTRMDKRLVHKVMLGQMPITPEEVLAEVAARVSALERAYFDLNAPTRQTQRFEENMNAEDSATFIVDDATVARVGTARVGLWQVA